MPGRLAVARVARELTRRVSYDINLAGQTASATRAAGELGVLTAEVPASLVGDDVGCFGLAKTDPTESQILLVWDGTWCCGPIFTL